jgi:hypothetical protein
MNAISKTGLKRTAAAALVAASIGALGLAAPSLAHPHPGGEGVNKVEKIIILSGKDTKDAKGGASLPRQFHMIRERGKDGLVGCKGEKTEVDETTTGKGSETTRVIFCHDDDLSDAERVTRLEQSLAKIRSNEHLSGEHKAKVEAALSEAIAKLRASK